MHLLEALHLLPNAQCALPRQRGPQAAIVVHVAQHDQQLLKLEGELLREMRRDRVECVLHNHGHERQHAVAIGLVSRGVAGELVQLPHIVLHPLAPCGWEGEPHALLVPLVLRVAGAHGGGGLAHHARQVLLVHAREVVRGRKLLDQLDERPQQGNQPGQLRVHVAKDGAVVYRVDAGGVQREHERNVEIRRRASPLHHTKLLVHRGVLLEQDQQALQRVHEDIAERRVHEPERRRAYVHDPQQHAAKVEQLAV